MATRAADAPTTTIGARIREALDDEGRAIDVTERELGMGKGHLNRIVNGERWKDGKIDANLARRMAALLHVNFDWLVFGEGPKRRDGRGETKAEIAMRFARQNGCQEDALQEVWSRNKDREADLDVDDWVVAFFQESARRKARATSPNLEIRVTGKDRARPANSPPDPAASNESAAPAKRPKKGAA